MQFIILSEKHNVNRTRLLKPGKGAGVWLVMESHSKTVISGMVQKMFEARTFDCKEGSLTTFHSGATSARRHAFCPNDTLESINVIPNQPGH